MNNSLAQVSTGSLQYQMRLDVISNNLANMNTVGYKSDKAFFRIPNAKENSNASSTVQNNGKNNENKPFQMKIDFRSGQLRETGNNLDIAVNGKGFICVSTNDGECYTRKGNLSINQNNILVTQNGEPIVGQKGEIEIKGSSIEIKSDGRIIVDGDEIDRLKIVDFSNTDVLAKKGGSLLENIDPEVKPIEAEGIKIEQGFLELSNVDAIGSMTEMIDIIRGFESYQKVIQFLNETSSKAINEVGRIG